MTTANQITLTRIAMIPFFIVFALQSTQVALIIALVIFCVASATDFLDGYIARKYNQVTDFGKFIDPLADKLLVTAALLIFVEQGQLFSWMAFVIIARELIITSLRNVAAAKGYVLAATHSGKVKTAVQIAGIILIFMVMILKGDSIDTEIVSTLSGWVMMLVTLYSGVDYMKRNWDLVKDGAVTPKQ